jgi:hypothetical protein
MYKRGIKPPVQRPVVPPIYNRLEGVDLRLASLLQHQQWGATRMMNGFRVRAEPLLRWMTHLATRVRERRHPRKCPHQLLSISQGSGSKAKTLPLFLALPRVQKRLNHNHVHACRRMASRQHVQRTPLSHQHDYPTCQSIPNTPRRNGILIANNQRAYTRSQIQPSKSLSPSPATRHLHIYQIKLSPRILLYVPLSLRPLWAEPGRNPQLRLRRGQSTTRLAEFAHRLRAHSLPTTRSVHTRLSAANLSVMAT